MGTGGCNSIARRAGRGCRSGDAPDSNQMARVDTSADRCVQRKPHVGVPNTARRAAERVDNEERKYARTVRGDRGPCAQRERRQTGAAERGPGACRRDRRRRNRRAGGRADGRAGGGEGAPRATVAHVPAALTGSGAASTSGRGHAVGAAATRNVHTAALLGLTRAHLCVSRRAIVLFRA